VTTQILLVQRAVVGEIAILLSALAWAGALEAKQQTGWLGRRGRSARPRKPLFATAAGQLSDRGSPSRSLDAAACEFSQLDPALDKLAGASLPDQATPAARWCPTP